MPFGRFWACLCNSLKLSNGNFFIFNHHCIHGLRHFYNFFGESTDSFRYASACELYSE